MGFQVRYLALFLLFSVIDGFKYFWMESLHKKIQLMLELLKGPFLVLNFSYYAVWSGIWCVVATRIDFWTWICSMRHCGLVQVVACWFQCWKSSASFFYRSNNTGAIDVKMDGSGLEETSSFKILGLTFFSKLNWGSYIISIAKTASKKIGALICSMQFLSPEVALYLYKSTIRPCMEYCCHFGASVPSCYLELLDKLQKRIYRTVGPSFASSLEPFGPLASLSLFYRYYFGSCSAGSTSFLSRKVYSLFWKIAWFFCHHS